MKTVLEWTTQAREDLLEIYLTIASDSVDAAERWLAAIEERVGCWRNLRGWACGGQRLKKQLEHLSLEPI